MSPTKYFVYVEEPTRTYRMTVNFELYKVSLDRLGDEGDGV